LQEHHLKNGYQLLYTPHVAKAEMWKTSGHLDFYAENMFDRIKVCLSSECCKSLCFGRLISNPDVCMQDASQVLHLLTPME